jgi:uncharacterized membrane protein YdjX (TVP38/TMEM64 family)
VAAFVALGFGLRSVEQAVAQLDLSVEGIERIAEAWGAWAPVASIALMILHSFVPFPAELIAIANGMLFGPVWGTLLTWLGAMLGAALAFGLARLYGRPLVERLVARKAWSGAGAPTSTLGVRGATAASQGVQAISQQQRTVLSHKSA